MTKYVGNFCGSRRVPNGRGLPIYAWKVNNDTQIADDEMLIRVVKIHLENGSFNQIYSEVGGNEEKMKETVMEIVKQRGKITIRIPAQADYSAALSRKLARILIMLITYAWVTK